LIFGAFGKNSYKSFTKKGLFDSNNVHFLASLGLFRVFFEQKLTDVSGSQQIVYFSADLHLPRTKTRFPASIYEEI